LAAKVLAPGTRSGGKVPLPYPEFKKSRPPGAAASKLRRREAAAFSEMGKL
jgi:hypothetical protein